MYNLARAYHHVGLLHLAVDLYEEVLAMPPSPPRPSPGGAAESVHPLDCKKQAAFNLVLIYKSSGANQLALEVMSCYINI